MTTLWSNMGSCGTQVSPQCSFLSREKVGRVALRNNILSLGLKLKWESLLREFHILLERVTLVSGVGGAELSVGFFRPELPLLLRYGCCYCWWIEAKHIRKEVISSKFQYKACHRMVIFSFLTLNLCIL